jgi:hypothetical protein
LSLSSLMLGRYLMMLGIGFSTNIWVKLVIEYGVKSGVRLKH